MNENHKIIELTVERQSKVLNHSEKANEKKEISTIEKRINQLITLRDERSQTTIGKTFWNTQTMRRRKSVRNEGMKRMFLLHLRQKKQFNIPVSILEFGVGRREKVALPRYCM